nr:transposase [Desulfobacter postgatei]
MISRSLILKCSKRLQQLKENDLSDAQKICDLLRVDLLPECYMAPSELRELRRILRYRNHIVRTATQTKIKSLDF